MQTKSRNFIIWSSLGHRCVVHSRVAGKPIFRSSCWTNKPSGGKCAFVGWIKRREFIVQCMMQKVTGLPLASILRMSLGLPATTFTGSLASFKGSSLVWTGSCAEVSCFAYMMDALCPCCNSVIGSVLSNNVTISCCILSGVLAHYSSNRFIEKPNLVVHRVNARNLWNRSKPENEGRKPSSMQTANGEHGTTNSYGWLCN